MSYILDALKKSQQERELGQVPTLETTTFATDAEETRPKALILAAVILATLAVAIALYSVLRNGSEVSEPDASVADSAPNRLPESLNQEPLAPAASSPVGPRPAKPVSEASVAQKPAGSSASRASRERRAKDRSVVMEAPATAESRSSAPATAVAAGAGSPVGARREERSKVPPDLIADIEAFKREVSGEQTGNKDAAKKDRDIAPQDLRLPKDVRNRLPELVMSAHVYDTEPSKRFVLINGLKTREGEEARDEIKVEQILPDGAVLSFDGHRFFEHR